MGTYASGQRTMPDLIDDIANGLLATGNWWNVDSTWNTSIRTGDSARRCMAYGAAGGSGKGDTTLSSGISAGVTALPVTS